MKKTVVTTHLSGASLPKIWENISKSTDVNTWLPIVTTCELQGEGEGAKRICGTEKGNLYETIFKIDHAQHIFKYSIDQQDWFLPSMSEIERPPSNFGHFF